MCSFYQFVDIALCHHEIWDFYWIFMAILFVSITSRLNFLQPSSSGSANAHLPECFHPWTFTLNIGFNLLPPDSFLSRLDSLLVYFTGEFQAL